MGYRKDLVKKFLPSVANEFYKENFDNVIEIIKKNKNIADEELIRKLQYSIRTFQIKRPLREQLVTFILYLVVYFIIIFLTAITITYMWPTSIFIYIVPYVSTGMLFKTMLICFLIYNSIKALYNIAVELTEDLDKKD